MALAKSGTLGKSLLLVPDLLSLSVSEARRFVRRASLLDRPAGSLQEAIEAMGYVQVDPLNICGRMHDLVLRHRVVGYREGDLHHHAHGKNRPAFEHYMPGMGILVVFPAASWPYLLATMRARRTRRGTYSGRLSKAQEVLAQRILAELAARGPLLSDDIEHSERAETGWGSQAREAKVVLEKLFFHGRVLITDRRGFRRVYDLPERVLPAAILTLPEPKPREVARWQAITKLQQRRLAVLKRDEVKAIGDAAVAVAIPGCPKAYILRSDLPLAEAVKREPPTHSVHPLFLAPLDPVVYDRKLTDKLWSFAYTWEAYTPIHKRVRGHFSLPVLEGLEIIGTVDPKADRAAGKLAVGGRRLRRGKNVNPAIEALAGFLGLKAPHRAKLKT